MLLQNLKDIPFKLALFERGQALEDYWDLLFNAFNQSQAQVQGQAQPTQNPAVNPGPNPAHPGPPLNATPPNLPPTQQPKLPPSIELVSPPSTGPSSPSAPASPTPAPPKESPASPSSTPLVDEGQRLPDYAPSGDIVVSKSKKIRKTRKKPIAAIINPSPSSEPTTPTKSSTPSPPTQLATLEPAANVESTPVVTPAKSTTIADQSAELPSQDQVGIDASVRFVMLRLYYELLVLIVCFFQSNSRQPQGANCPTNFPDLLFRCSQSQATRSRVISSCRTSTYGPISRRRLTSYSSTSPRN